MKKKLVALVIMTLVMLRGISQEKPPEYVKIKLSDARAVIESNERGKKAQALVPVLQIKIDTLESITRFLHSRIESLSIIKEAHERQILDYSKIVYNDSLILENQLFINSDLKKQLRTTQSKFIAQKAATWFAIIAGCIMTTAAILTRK